MDLYTEMNKRKIIFWSAVATGTVILLLLGALLLSSPGASIKNDLKDDLSSSTDWWSSGEPEHGNHLTMGRTFRVKTIVRVSTVVIISFLSIALVAYMVYLVWMDLFPSHTSADTVETGLEEDARPAEEFDWKTMLLRIVLIILGLFTLTAIAWKAWPKEVRDEDSMSREELRFAIDRKVHSFEHILKSKAPINMKIARQLLEASIAHVPAGSRVAPIFGAIHENWEFFEKDEPMKQRISAFIKEHLGKVIKGQRKSKPLQYKVDLLGSRWKQSVEEAELIETVDFKAGEAFGTQVWATILKDDKMTIRALLYMIRRYRPSFTNAARMIAFREFEKELSVLRRLDKLIALLKSPPS